MAVAIPPEQQRLMALICECLAYIDHLERQVVRLAPLEIAQAESGPLQSLVVAS